MRRIEFLGVEGIGKTTLYKELVRCRSKRDKWMTTEEARLKIASEYLKNNPTSFKNHIMGALLKFNKSKWIQSNICDSVLSIPQEINFLTHNGLYRDFLSNILKFYSTNDYPPELTIIRIARLYQAINKLTYLENFVSEKVFLSESDNISMGGLFLWKGQNELINEFFYTMPLPIGLIYCYLDQEEAIKRIIERKNKRIITIEHRDPENYNLILDNDRLREIIQNQSNIASIGVNILRNRGVKILKINMGDTLVCNVEKISNFLNNATFG